jgi:hypothetical protein
MVSWGRATYRDFAQGKALDLIWACAPVHLSHKALPEARDEFSLRERTLLNNGVYSSDDLFPSIFSNPKTKKKLNLDARRKVGRHVLWRL